MQAPIEYDLYTELPKGFNTKEVDVLAHVLQLPKNMYRQKQAGRVWKNNINNELCEIGFKESAVEECVWYRDKNIFFYYVDNGIFMETD